VGSSELPAAGSGLAIMVWRKRVSGTRDCNGVDWVDGAIALVLTPWGLVLASLCAVPSTGTSAVPSIDGAGTCRPEMGSRSAHPVLGCNSLPCMDLR